MGEIVSQRRALLVGINYLDSKNNRLFGCINDVVNMRTMLMKKFGYTAYDIITLRDDVKSSMPTKSSIMLGLNRLAEISTPTSETVIHYSGHGAQVRDRNRDEPDGLDEVIVPVDSSSAGIITDDEIFAIISRIRGRVLLFFDSCHSGSVCDLQYSLEYNNGSVIKKVNNKKKISNPNIIMMSGCKDNQLSADSYNFETKQSIGAFTDSLLSVLSTKTEPIDLIEVYKDVCVKLSLSGYTQLPVFSCSKEHSQYLYGGVGKTSFGSTIQNVSLKPIYNNNKIIKASFKGIINI